MKQWCLILAFLIGRSMIIHGQEYQLLLNPEFVSPNCVELSAANGSYHFNFTPKGISIPGYLQVIPEQLFTDSNELKLYGLRHEIPPTPSELYDQFSYVQFPCDSFDARYAKFKNVDFYNKNYYFKEAKANPELLKGSPFLIVEPKLVDYVSLSDTTSWSLGINYINGGPISVPANKYEGVIDGLYYEQFCYQLQGFTFGKEKEIDSTKNIYAEYRESILTPQIEPLLQPFYLSQFELTNKEYNTFKQWVIDSLTLETAYWKNDDDELAAALLNCSKKELKSLDFYDKKENYARFGLKCPDKSMNDFRNNPDYIPVLAEIYYPQPMRFYKRRELDSKFWNYKMNDSTFINITPDSLKFLCFPTFESDSWTNMYHWHPAYDNHPVVNVSYEQLKAFCHWKTQQIQNEFKRKGFKVSVEIPKLYEYELALKTIVPAAKDLIIDHSNDDYFIEIRDFNDEQPIRLWLKKVTDYHTFTSNLYNEKQIFEFNQWLYANYFKGLNFINGNVSEYCSTPITEELLEQNNIPIPDGDLENYVLVLGSNYFQDVKSKSGSNVNTIFYKSLQMKSESNATTGARLIVRTSSLKLAQLRFIFLRDSSGKCYVK